MLTIETVATVTKEGTITAKVPGSLRQGEHRVVIVVDESLLRETSSRFPDMSAFRENLGVPRHPGNTVIEMREETALEGRHLNSLGFQPQVGRVKIIQP